MTIAATAITIDGDTAWWIVEHRLCPTHAPCDCGRFGLPFGLPHCKLSCELGSVTGLARALNLDCPCDTCDGSGSFPAIQSQTDPCPDCDGSKRHTFNIHLSEGQHETLSVHVVEVLEIVRGSCPDKTNAPHRRAHLHLDDNEDQAGMCRENRDLIWDSPWKSRNLVTLPTDAAAGKYVVRLAMHT
jgi:hypothetical protein